MHGNKGLYTFRAVVADDLELLAEWVKEPEVLRWFEDPDYADDLEENLEDKRIGMQLVLHKDDPIAYVQDYDIHAWTNHHLNYLPLGSRGIDTFVGAGKLIGQGHGTNYLSQFSEQLFRDGVPALGIDPDPENLVAQRVYAKIGFTEDGIVESEWGTVLTMSLSNSIRL